jgi:hypothetical protein
MSIRTTPSYELHVMETAEIFCSLIASLYRTVLEATID